MTKDTHIAVRTTIAAKTYSTARLRAIGSHYTISDLYHALSEGRGVVAPVDLVAIEQLKQCLSTSRGVHLPASDKLPDPESDEQRKALRTIRATVKSELMPAKAELMEAILRAIAMVGEGTTPIYLYNLDCFNSIDKPASVIDATLGDQDISSFTPEEIAEICRKKEYSLQKPAYSTQYTIRASWDDRPSMTGDRYLHSLSLADETKRRKSEFSDQVRNSLNYIHDIPALTSPQYQESLRNLEHLLEECKAYMASFVNPEMLEDIDTNVADIREYGTRLYQFIKSLEI